MAKLRYHSACLEDVDFRQSRGLAKPLFALLAACDLERQPKHIVFTGATGTGKYYTECTRYINVLSIGEPST